MSTAVTGVESSSGVGETSLGVVCDQRRQLLVMNARRFATPAARAVPGSARARVNLLID